MAVKVPYYSPLPLGSVIFKCHTGCYWRKQLLTDIWKHFRSLKQGIKVICVIAQVTFISTPGQTIDKYSALKEIRRENMCKSQRSVDTKTKENLYYTTFWILLGGDGNMYVILLGLISTFVLTRISSWKKEFLKS